MTELTKKKIVLLITAIILVIAAIPALTSIAKALQKEIAYQFYVDGEIWATIADKEALENMLEEYKMQYSKSVDINATIKNTYIQQHIEIVEVEVMPEEIDPLDTAKEKIYAAEREEVTIEVQSGDNLWNLSKEHELTVSDIEILNPEVDPDKIFPGDVLVVKPFDPVLDVVIELENTIVESIPFKIDYQKDNNLYKNQKKILKEGIEGQKEVTYDITLLNGYQNSLEVVNEVVLEEPVNAIVQIGTKSTVSRGGSINYGVVSGKRISSPYGTRVHPITGRKTYHDGVDIAANYGNGVYAYTDGKVIEAGWNGGYGNCILIDHGNGLKTRYAHLSKISVKVGQRVSTGDRIGSVGSTGNSTGPHLHFEVIKNGQTKNPLNYI